MSTLNGRSGGRLRISVAVVALPCLIAAAYPALAQGSNPGEAKLRLEESKRNLTSKEQRARALQQDVASLRGEQAEINAKLIEAGRLAQQSEIRMSRIESRLGELDEQEKMIRGSLSQRHGQMARLFAAMQRMGRNPPPVIVTRREDALKMVRSAMLLARAFPELKAQADMLSTRLNDLVRVMAAARDERARLKSETEKLTEAKTRLSTLVESKRQSLAERQQELAEVQRAAAEISRSVSGLSELISRLDKEVEARTALGEYNREQAAKAAAESKARSAEAAPSQAASQAAQGAVASKQTSPTQSPPAQVAQGPAPAAKSPSSPGQPKIAALPGAGSGKAGAATAREPQIALLPQGPLTQNPGRMKPAIAFEKAHGQLPLPALGKRLLGFGDRTQLGSTSKGVVIETRGGATVVSPCDGWIVYAGAFRSYGQVLIINAGGGYHVLLANLARIDVEVGRFVLAAEPVGTMETKLPRSGRDTAPVLYVEFRNKQGNSIDPSPWWAEGSQKVQG